MCVCVGGRVRGKKGREVEREAGGGGGEQTGQSEKVSERGILQHHFSQDYQLPNKHRY